MDVQCLQEVERRFAAWAANLEYVYEHNLKPDVSYWVRRPFAKCF